MATAEAAPLAAALMETYPPVITEGQGDGAEESGALFSEREVSEQVVDGDSYLVERAAGLHIVKEIIIYDVYDNDNVVADNLVDPTTANEIEDPKTNVVVEGNDSDNCLEYFTVAEHVAALNQNAEIVVNNVVDAAEGSAKQNVESNDVNNLESSVGSANNGAQFTEEINNVVDEIVDNNPELNESVAVVVVEGWRRRSPRSSLRPQIP